MRSSGSWLLAAAVAGAGLALAHGAAAQPQTQPQTTGQSPPSPPDAAMQGTAATQAKVSAPDGPTSLQPKWELGMGLAGLQLPHYRGSDQRYSLLLPVPYFVYRGDILRADREGTRAVLLDADAVELDISLAAGNPTRSDDNSARSGMPNLAPTLEIGPKLNWTLTRRAGGKLDLRLPVRAVMAIGGNTRVLGWTATPHLNLDIYQAGGWRLGFLAGLQFAGRGVNSYYYDVTDSQATANRAAYRARAGFGGLDALAAVSRRNGNRWMGAFLRWDSLAGATFASSPLVRQRQQWTAGVAVSWSLLKSEALVDWPK